VRRCEPNALVCDKCGRRYPVFENRLRCECGGLLHFEIKSIKNLTSQKPKIRGVWKYKNFIPIPKNAEIISMGEGATPLVRLKRIGDMLKLKDLFIKLEGSNPTGSFKDRGMTVAVTAAKAMGARAVISASTGNTAASMSAYARRAGLQAIVVVPKGKIAGGKVSQLALYGAAVLEVIGSFDNAMKKVLELSERYRGFYLMNSINPWRIEGQKTVAFEIVEEIGVPDWIVVPVGNGGNIFSIWKGLNELRSAGIIENLPRILAVQASGASPIANAFQTGKYADISSPSTVASAINIGRPVHWERAIKAIKESSGQAVAVNDDNILKSQLDLARSEGIGVESASAVTLAGLRRALEEEWIEKGERVVLIGTGNALKEADQIPNRFPLNILQSGEGLEIFRKLGGEM
jgi:threonine synthase